eukprot:4582657-Pleurochrysis_carterae.AAC.2
MRCAVELVVMQIEIESLTLVKTLSFPHSRQNRLKDTTALVTLSCAHISGARHQLKMACSVSERPTKFVLLTKLLHRLEPEHGQACIAATAAAASNTDDAYQAKPKQRLRCCREEQRHKGYQG